MSDDSLARSQSAMLSSVDADYDAIHATIVATERGRWFLEQHMHRIRGTDNDRVLAAIERIERAIRGDTTAEPTEVARPDLAALAESIHQTRADLAGQHGDLAASGEAALADFRNAIEQIQELVWDMHGRDAVSEFGSQLSLQTNRLTAAGDRLERSLGGLRILLGLLDDLDQQLRATTEAPVAEPASREPASLKAVPAGPASATAMEPQEPTALPAVTLAAVAWPSIASAGHGETAAAAASHPGLPPEPNGRPITELGREPLPQEPAFERAWQEIPGPSALTPASPSEAAAEPPSEAAVTDWTVVANDTESTLDHAAPIPPLPVDAAPNSEQPWEQSTPEPAMSAIERLEARESDRLLDTPAEPPQAHTAPSAPAEPKPPSLDELVMSPPPADEQQAFAGTSMQSGAYVHEPSNVEWFEVPAAAEPMFDADLFESDDRSNTGHDALVHAAAEPDTREPPADSLDWLTADAGAEEQDDAEPAAPDEEPAAARAEPADAIPDSIAALTEPDRAEEPIAELADEAAAEPAEEPVAQEEPVTAAMESAAPPPEPEALDSLFAEPALEPDATAQPASALFDDGANEAEPDAEQPESLSLLDDSNEEPEVAEAQPPEPDEPPTPAPAASLYDEPSYAEPAPSVRAYAGRAYSHQTDAELASVTPATPAYDWPSTFPDRSSERPAADRSAAGAHASAAYQALQSQSVAPAATPDHEPLQPDTQGAEPSQDADDQGPFADEGPDVPTVLERLESVRSAIAALMDEVNERNARRGSM